MSTILFMTYLKLCLEFDNRKSPYTFKIVSKLFFKYSEKKYENFYNHKKSHFLQDSISMSKII